VTALVIITLACHHGATSGADAPGPFTTGPRATIRNYNWLDVTIYVVRGGARSRLGIVNGQDSRTFLLPKALMPTGTVRLMVDPIAASGRYVSDEITVSPGQVVELTVMPSLGMSTFAIRSR
jgi:hypothetical protein